MSELQYLRDPWRGPDRPLPRPYRSPAGQAADARQVGATVFQWVTVVTEPSRADTLRIRSRSETLALIESQGWTLFSRMVTRGRRLNSSTNSGKWAAGKSAPVYGPGNAIYLFRVNPLIEPPVLTHDEGYDVEPGFR